MLLRRRKEEVVALPEKTFAVRDVMLSGDQLKRYEEIRKELLLRITSAEGQAFTRQIESILEEYLRAVQIASNPRLVDENWKGEPAKFLELDEIVRELVDEQGRKIVIWTNYRQNVHELVDRYSDYAAAGFSGEVSQAERMAVIDDFQSQASDSCKVLVAIPAAGGVGITLTAAQTAVYIDKTWNAEHWMQSIDRLHRIGQKGSVTIVSLHACKVDEYISNNLAKKQKMQAQLLGEGKPDHRMLTPTREELLALVGAASK